MVKYPGRLGRNAFIHATLNRYKRLQAHNVPLIVFDKENVLFSLSSDQITKLIIEAETEAVMANYEKG